MIKKKKERREQPNQKTNPPMITSAKNYTKKNKKKTDRENPRTNGKSKAIQTKSHTQAHIHKYTHHTHTQVFVLLYLGGEHSFLCENH